MKKQITHQPSSLNVRRSKLVKRKRRLEGEVVSDKMEKTVVVKVSRLKLHPKYKRHYRVSRRFKAHDEKNQYHKGDKVIIEESRPLSKEKRWRVINARKF